jgi:hypothetical protein
MAGGEMSIGDQPAFPVVFDHGECTSETPGMTYRQYLVAKVVSGMAGQAITIETAQILGEIRNNSGVDPAVTMATVAIELVDAVLKKLEEK